MEIKSFVGFKNYVFVLLIWGVFTGCSSSKIAINVVCLPENPFSEKVESIALINELSLSDAKTNQYINGRVVAQLDDYTNYIVDNTFYKLEHVLNNGQYFNVFDTTLNFLPKNGSFNSHPVPAALISRACHVLNTDAIVSIEGYYADVDSDSDVRYSTPVDRNYGTVQVPYFDGEQNVDMRMLFRGYLCQNNGGEINLESEVGTQVSMSATGSSPHEVRLNMRRGGSILMEASNKIAVDFALQIGPRRENQTRKIFTKGNDQMAEAYRLANFGNWKGANDIWYLLATSNNKSIAGKATFNLILGNEVLGNYSEALELATICIDKFQMKNAVSYKQVLISREAEMKQVFRLFPSVIL